MATNFDSRINQSYLAQQISIQNFCPQISAKLAVTTASASVTFSPLTGALRSTFQISNSGTTGCYVGWGATTATAVASTGTPAANCTYIAPGAIFTYDFQPSASAGPNSFPVDTLAAICGTGSTTLEITYGSGQ